MNLYRRIFSDHFFQWQENSSFFPGLVGRASHVLISLDFFSLLFVVFFFSGTKGTWLPGNPWGRGMTTWPRSYHMGIFFPDESYRALRRRRRLPSLSGRTCRAFSGGAVGFSAKDSDKNFFSPLEWFRLLRRPVFWSSGVFAARKRILFLALREHGCRDRKWPILRHRIESLPAYAQSLFFFLLCQVSRSAGSVHDASFFTALSLSDLRRPLLKNAADLWRSSGLPVLKFPTLAGHFLRCGAYGRFAAPAFTFSVFFC